MNWKPGPISERPDPTRNVRLFKCGLLLNGNYVGAISLCISDQALVYRGLSKLAESELGKELLSVMTPHIDGLFRTGWLPRNDDSVLELRVVGSDVVLGHRQGGVATIVPSRVEQLEGRNRASFQRLSVTGMFGFGPTQHLPLHPRCTVGVGENGSGKTSIRRLFDALRNIARGEVPFFADESWLHVGAPGMEPVHPALDVQASLSNNATLRYGLSFGSAKGGAATISGEHLENDLAPPLKWCLTRPDPVFDSVFLQRTRVPASTNDSVVAVAGPADPSRSSLSQLANFTLYPEASAVRDLLSEVRLYSSWDLADAKLVARSAVGSSGDDISNLPPALFDDGSNLAGFIARLQRNGNKPRFDDWFERVMDGRPMLRVDADRLVYEHDGRLLSVLDLSDGSLRWAQVVAACMSPASLRVFDEPELGLHPDLIASLADLIAEASISTQTLVFTHSRDLLDRLEGAFTESGDFGLVAFDQHQNGNLLSEPDFSSIRDDEELRELNLGDLWVKGFLGGNRW
jgi:predicted ATPase